MCVARVLAVVWSADVSFGGGVWADLGIWGGIEHFTQMQMIFGEFFVCVVDGMAWGKSASCVVFPVEGEGLIMIVFFFCGAPFGLGIRDEVDITVRPELSYFTFLEIESGY